MVRSFFRLGLSMGLSELEFLGQIASFEHRLCGAAPTCSGIPLPNRGFKAVSTTARIENHGDVPFGLL